MSISQCVIVRTFGHTDTTVVYTDVYNDAVTVYTQFTLTDSPNQSESHAMAPWHLLNTPRAAI